MADLDADLMMLLVAEAQVASPAPDNPFALGEGTLLAIGLLRPLVDTGPGRTEEDAEELVTAELSSMAIGCRIGYEYARRAAGGGVFGGLAEG
jgi:hypothetical protein